jgi:CRISPR-associated protein Cas5t
MEAVRIDLRAYTASFRVPGMMGYQTTSPVPPPSTIYGLLAAATGREVRPEETWIAYRFEYKALAHDLEKIIAFPDGGPRWDKKLNAVNTLPITRQFLFEPHLILYVKPGIVAQAFLRPRYPLLLGRSQDVAFVEHFEDTVLEAVGEANMSGVLLPFPAPGIPSRISSFPTYFSIGTPRRALAVKPFHILDFLKGPQRARLSDSLFRQIGGGEFAVPMFDQWLLYP